MFVWKADFPYLIFHFSFGIADVIQAVQSSAFRLRLGNAGLFDEGQSDSTPASSQVGKEDLSPRGFAAFRAERLCLSDDTTNTP